MRVVPPLTGHLDMALSNYTKGYRQAPLIADYLYPRLPVLRQTDKYWIYGRENQQLAEGTLRAPGTSPQESRFTMSLGSYFANSHALKATIADEDRSNYTVGDLTQTTVSTLQDKIDLDRELRGKALAMTAANYPVANTLALNAGAKWSDYVNSDPIGDVELAKNQIALTGSAANILFLGPDIYKTLRNHPKLIARVQYNSASDFSGSLSAKQMATIFDVDQVIVARGVQHDGVNPFYIWNGLALLAYVSPTTLPAGVFEAIGQEGKIGPKELSFGKSFTWMEAPQTIGGYGVVIARHPDATAKADIVGVDSYYDLQITAADCGYLWTGVL